jgi:phosphoenolpyruvate carboxykinase (diphosphate)
MKRELDRYINLKLAAMGERTLHEAADTAFMELAAPLLLNFHQKDQMLKHRLCPVDARIQEYLDSHLADVCPGGAPKLPGSTFVADRAGLARTLCFPPGVNVFRSPYVHSYRVAQGVLHNPKSDRRTTKGVFHVAEGGLPVPADKVSVPKATFAALLAAALRPPGDVLTLPYTSGLAQPVRLFVSLLLRPLVMPASGWGPEKTMEIRFFAPGTLVANLDFVEAIFGNGGDPFLPENDAALDATHWTGHTGCVILAPHLADLKKKDLGLPRVDEATERQKRDGMCWASEDERYNGGQAFKIACRDQRGVMVTIIADSYFGYCKKEVKTQISYSANLYGLCEEEHSGGAIAFPAYVLGQEFVADRTLQLKPGKFPDALTLLGSRAEVKPEGYAVDRAFPTILYVPENSAFSVREGTVRWAQDGQPRKITLRAGEVYMLPSGYSVRLEKQPAGGAWRLVGTRPDGTLCHKPCTVSGGGKSEISKSLSGALLRGPVFVKDYYEDLDRVAEVLAKDFSNIYRTPIPASRAKRPILSVDRSLGSVIKLLTPSDDYTDEYNAWLRALPQTIRQLVFTTKRYYQPGWDTNLFEHFTVDRINGFLGHELKLDGQKLVSNYLRVGFDPDGSWRIYKLRPDFFPAEKVQVEDDITASVVLPRQFLNHADDAYRNPSMKLVGNCEAMLFQRPDEAVHRGADKQAEQDVAAPGVFLSNFEPLTKDQAREIVDHVLDFDQYSSPMKRLLCDFVHSSDAEYVVSSAHARLVDGKPSKNPRYLQKRPDVTGARETYLASIGARLERKTPANEEVAFPVNAVLSGRRNSPPDAKLGLPPLAVYNPIHYQELPELFMEFISSLTGKSPSTTGFGSEGALTKGPFNALPAVIDLNNALVSMIVTEYDGFTTSAGYVGAKYRVDHDISMLVPEVWCRMRVKERDPRFLIENGYLERVEDFEHEGGVALASRLGYRITERFAETFLGRIFETPDAVFTEELLRPERQDPAQFAAGVDAIVESQRRVAQTYFEDNSVEAACPPLKMLLHIMAKCDYEGMTLTDPRVRAQFTRGAVLASDWYTQRLRTKQRKDAALWKRHIEALECFLASGMETPGRADFEARLAAARRELDRVTSANYLTQLVGTIGADPAAG